MNAQERAAMQQALEFLEDGSFVYPTQLADNLRAALAQEQEQKPDDEPSGYCTLEQLVVMQRTVPSPDKIAIYTAPPQRPPLTDEEIAEVYLEWDAAPGRSMADFARAIERKVRGEA